MLSWSSQALKVLVDSFETIPDYSGLHKLFKKF